MPRRFGLPRDQAIEGRDRRVLTGDLLAQAHALAFEGRGRLVRAGRADDRPDLLQRHPGGAEGADEFGDGDLIEAIVAVPRVRIDERRR